MSLVKFGGMAAAGFPDPFKTPWWVVLVVRMWTRVQSIIEAGAWDVEEQVAPKDFWLDEDNLDAWFEERKKLKSRPKTIDGY